MYILSLFITYFFLELIRQSLHNQISRNISTLMVTFLEYYAAEEVSNQTLVPKTEILLSE